VVYIRRVVYEEIDLDAIGAKAQVAFIKCQKTVPVRPAPASRRHVTLIYDQMEVAIVEIVLFGQIVREWHFNRTTGRVFDYPRNP
jgi:hypothetical protein